MVRPLSGIKILDAEGKLVADVPEAETLPVLGGAELNQKLTIPKALPAGTYSVKYRVDFQDGGKATEGITELVVKAPQIATSDKLVKKP